MNTKNIKILFFGTSEFAVPILQKLIDEKYNIVAVVTQPDKPVGRKQLLNPSPVKILAQKYNLPILQPEDLSTFNPSASLGTSVKDFLAFDLIITASYGKIIPKEILALPKYGALNVHPSLLPKYKGSSPIQYAILNGDKETGTTIMLMDEKMDHGKILAQKKIKIEDRQTFASLHNTLSLFSAELLAKTIPLWISNKIKPLPQDDSKATYTKIITKEDGKIDWNKSAEEIDRQIRAFSPWPGCWTILNIDGKEKRLKIIDAIAGAGHCSVSTKPGKIIKAENKKMAILCGHNSYLEINQIQMEGKKIMNGEEFINGYTNDFKMILLHTNYI